LEIGVKKKNHNLFCFEKCHGVVNIKNMAMKRVECLRESLSMRAVDTKKLSIALKNKNKKNYQWVCEKHCK
jgi:hypothetical protein